LFRVVVIHAAKETPSKTRVAFVGNVGSRDIVLVSGRLRSQSASFNNNSDIR
jgi:hypothetical protein